MPLSADDELFVYGGAPSAGADADDPDLSIGGLAPVGNLAGSRMHRPQDTDAPHSVGSRTIVDTQATGAADDPAVGDWYSHILGANSGFRAKVESIDGGSTRFTLDRALPSPPVAQTNFRTTKRENLFDNITEEQVLDGFEDYRQIWHVHNNDSAGFGFRFYIDPIKPNGCDIELQCTSLPPDVTVDDPDLHEPTDRFEDPFDANGVIQSVPGNSDTVFGISKRQITYASETALPRLGTTNRNNTDQYTAIWLKRTVPKGAGTGECAFALVMIIDDPTAQDAGADPVPYRSEFIFSWHNEQPTYSATITQDRTAYQRGAAKITATIVDSRGLPAENLNAYFDLSSGAGSIVTDKTSITDANGQITTVYTSPDTVPGSDPVIRINIPENLET